MFDYKFTQKGENSKIDIFDVFAGSRDHVASPGIKMLTKTTRDSMRKLAENTGSAPLGKIDDRDLTSSFFERSVCQHSGFFIPGLQIREDNTTASMVSFIPSKKA